MLMRRTTVACLVTTLSAGDGRPYGHHLAALENGASVRARWHVFTVHQNQMHKAGYADSWLARLMGRRTKKLAAVALANKSARTVWALLAHGRDYQADYEPAAA
jgi:transposase